MTFVGIAALCAAFFTLGLACGRAMVARRTNGIARATINDCQSMSMKQSPGSSTLQTPNEFNKGRAP